MKRILIIICFFIVSCNEYSVVELQSARLPNNIVFLELDNVIYSNVEYIKGIQSTNGEIFKINDTYILRPKTIGEGELIIKRKRSEESTIKFRVMNVPKPKIEVQSSIHKKSQKDNVLDYRLSVENYIQLQNNEKIYFNINSKIISFDVIFMNEDNILYVYKNDGRRFSKKFYDYSFENINLITDIKLQNIEIIYDNNYEFTSENISFPLELLNKLKKVNVSD